MFFFPPLETRTLYLDRCSEFCKIHLPCGRTTQFAISSFGSTFSWQKNLHMLLFTVQDSWTTQFCVPRWRSLLILFGWSTASSTRPPQQYRPGNKTENWLCLSARVDVLRFRRQRCKLYLVPVLILWTFILTKNYYTYFVPFLMIFIWQTSVVSITVFTWFIYSESIIYYIFYVNQA